MVSGDVEVGELVPAMARCRCVIVTLVYWDPGIKIFAC